MDKLKKVLSGQDDPNGDGTGILERASQASTLSCGTRMKGFVVCFLLGIFSAMVGAGGLFIPGFGLAVFGVLYSLANIFTLTSTLFLIGPCRQLKTMCAKERALATILMMVFLVLTLCAAFWWKNNAMAMVFCGLQFGAYTWYGLSYVPFAREAVKKVFSICF